MKVIAEPECTANEFVAVSQPAAPVRPPAPVTNTRTGLGIATDILGKRSVCEWQTWQQGCGGLACFGTSRQHAFLDADRQDYGLCDVCMLLLIGVVKPSTYTRQWLLLLGASLNATVNICMKVESFVGLRDMT